MKMQIEIKTSQREELIDITNLVRGELKKSGINEGILHLFTPHATCGLTINENADKNIPKDISNFLNRLVEKGKWMHDKIDNNADAHIKTSLIGNSVFIPIENNELCLGEWQDVFLCEFDGERRRKIILSFIK